MGYRASRKLNWVSSMEAQDEIDELEKSLSEFYSTDKSYFSSIDFTADNWINDDEKAYKKILEITLQSNLLCEIGCGNANILKHHYDLHSKYTGLDFSETILRTNRAKYPAARFISFKSPNEFPVADQLYDVVFCVFVLEHVTRPATFLDECTRILKPGGKLIILCPDYLGRRRMTSQRAGFSEGTAGEKLRKQKYFDAFVTLFDNRIRIPLACKHYANKARKRPLFLINCSPVVFTDNFRHDADAVYLTFKSEIVTYLNANFKEIKNDQLIAEHEFKKKSIFLQMVKN